MWRPKPDDLLLHTLFAPVVKVPALFHIICVYLPELDVAATKKKRRKEKKRKSKKQSSRLTFQIVRGILKGKKGIPPLKSRSVLHFGGSLSSKRSLGLYDTLLAYRMV